MAIETVNGISAALPTAQRLRWQKASVTSVAGGYVSLWASAGLPGAGSASPGNTTTGVTLTKLTPGGLPFANAAAGATNYIDRSMITPAAAGTFILVDRLVHQGSFTPANATINSTASVALSRYATTGAEVWAEINTAFSATAYTITFSYVNQDGVTRTNGGSIAIPASAGSARMFPATLQAGDTTVRQILNHSGNAAPTGSYNLILLRVLLEVSAVTASVGVTYDFATTGREVVIDDACLAWMALTVGTSTGAFFARLHLTQG